MPARVAPRTLRGVGGAPLVGRAEREPRDACRRQLGLPERGAHRLRNVARIAVARSEARLRHLHGTLRVGAPEVRELLGDGRRRHELGDHAVRADRDRGRAVAEERLQLRLGLGEPRIGRDDQRAPDAARPDRVDRGAERRDAGPHGAAEVRDGSRARQVGGGRDDARHLLLEIRRARAGEVESIEVGGVGTVEARERRVDGHGEGVLVETGDRAPAGRHAGAPRLSDHGPVEAPTRNVRRDAGDAGHRRSRDIYYSVPGQASGP